MRVQRRAVRREQTVPQSSGSRLAFCFAINLERGGFSDAFSVDERSPRG